MTDLSTTHAPVVLDVAGTELTADDRRRLAHPLVGGLILFARNWRDRRQLVALTAECKAIRPDLLICVDHEGGRVQRFRSDGFTQLPPMRRLGELWMRDAMAATDAATGCGFVLGAELRACGVDLSFTPVLDLDHGPSGVIGDRAFHRDPRVVALLAKTVASTSPATASSPPTATPTFPSTAARRRRSSPTTRSRTRGCRRAWPA